MPGTFQVILSIGPLFLGASFRVRLSSRSGALTSCLGIVTDFLKWAACQASNTPQRNRVFFVRFLNPGWRVGGMGQLPEPARKAALVPEWVLCCVIRDKALEKAEQRKRRHVPD